jgi:hypothetical protein
MRVNCGPGWQDVGIKRQLAMYVWNFELECFKTRDALDINLFRNRMQGACGFLKGTGIHKPLAPFAFWPGFQKFRPVLTRDLL